MTKFERLVSSVSMDRIHFQSVKPVRWLLLMIVVYFGLLSYIVILRFNSFQTNAFDLGIFNQAFSTALSGKLFLETPDQHVIFSGSYLGTHFNLLMFLLLPIYALFPHPQTLLVVQTGFIALGALPIYLIAKRVINNEKLALFMATIYLLNPAILNLNLYDFHLEAFLPFFLGMFYYFYVVSNWRGYTVFLILSLITIEFASLLVVTICLAHALRNLTFGHKTGSKISFNLDRSRAMILLLTVVIAMVTFYATIQLSGFFSGKSVSVQGVLSGFINPVQGYRELLSKSEFWMLCLIPLMFLPLLVPSQLVMVAPWFLVVLLGANPVSYSFGYQDAGAFVLPYLIIAMIFGVEKMHSRHIDLRGFAVGMLLFAIVLSPLTPLVQNRISGIAYEQGFPVVSSHDEILDDALKLDSNKCLCFDPE